MVGREVGIGLGDVGNPNRGTGGNRLLAGDGDAQALDSRLRGARVRDFSRGEGDEGLCFVSERLAETIDESAIRVGVEGEVALGGSHRGARIEPGGHRVIGTERLESNVLT